MTIQPNSLVKDLVIQIPGADDLFKHNRIDFCCNGNRPLDEAAGEKNVDVDELTEKLEALAEQAKQRKAATTFAWEDIRTAKLIDHIVFHHHDFLREEFQELTFYVNKIDKVHGPDQPFLIEVNRLFEELKADMLEHVHQEEEALFPAIIHYEETKTEEAYQAVIDQLQGFEDEHSKTGDLLRQIRETANDYVTPESACMTFRRTFNRLEAIESDTFQHIHLENNILFPRVVEPTTV
ncbi:iron-sulfur cluster repair di-iron protein [Salisediminibacterium selenitireducens]|uniref:Iron-sulfur cluster repair di-iron protein n=1 Tax=Bacillus selenitireducens (strain ATCC 700615 / DSM 15326 / MLS10) TaxID=439292 RepID=D6XYM3_BACIE|nr:iron-sulfur cluster repair di-iron protein [Salisediminibacterium selenitireducens]ADH98181.1 iron-sulfur cluster repair di-iron protein [[Bacillus] selenitireducens MLS10]